MKPRPFLFVAIIILTIYLSQLSPLCVPITEGNITQEETPSAEFTTQEEQDLRDIISEVKKVIVRTTGNSMEPTISKDERCLCEKKENYKIGEIVMFIRKDGLAVAHRIIKKDDGKFITKGDNNKFSDYPIEESQIICHIPEVPLWKVLLM